MTRHQLKRWLFRTEMRIRSRLGLDCSGCIQREIDWLDRDRRWRGVLAKLERIAKLRP